MHPFLDVSKLKDEEIIERLGKAYAYMNYQVALGHNPTVQSIKEVIQSLEDERNLRMTKQMDEEYKRKYPDSQQPLDVGKVDLVDIEELIRKLV
jgi:nucleoid-associated protein YejK